VPSGPGIRSCRDDLCPLATLRGYPAGGSRNQREPSLVRPSDWCRILPWKITVRGRPGATRRDAPLGAPLTVIFARRGGEGKGEARLEPSDLFLIRVSARRLKQRFRASELRIGYCASPLPGPL
jgi:hypothetical protein